MTTYKKRPCIKCERLHMSKQDVCSWCLCRAERKRLEAEHGKCILCGKLKEDRRLLISAYCYECSNKTQRMSHACSVKVKKAIQRGDLPRLDGSVACVDCGAAARHYDHRDYNKPLAVDPVCASCNIKRGPAEKFIERLAA